MDLIRNIKSLVLLSLMVCFFGHYSFAQTANENCFEVKHLDFFGLDKQIEVKWSDEQINKLLEMDYAKNFKDTRFGIPPLIYQLKEFHPNCNKSIDQGRFAKLVSLYFKVRQKDISVIENKSIEEKLNYIREDFYKQIQDEKLLPLMRYTMDDGPFYGEIPTTIPKSKLLESIATDFGKLTIVKSNDRIFLIATNKENKTIWSRIIKGTNPDRYLKDLTSAENGIEKTSLATIIRFISEGERLTLYLKPDGKFMYYYHSW